MCYLSEPMEKKNQTKYSHTKKKNQTKYRYAHNYNVIFEARILDFLVSSVDVAPRGQIPIREEDSPSTPSDLA